MDVIIQVPIATKKNWIQFESLAHTKLRMDVKQLHQIPRTKSLGNQLTCKVVGTKLCQTAPISPANIIWGQG